MKRLITVLLCVSFLLSMAAIAPVSAAKLDEKAQEKEYDFVLDSWDLVLAGKKPAGQVLGASDVAASLDSYYGGRVLWHYSGASAWDNASFGGTTAKNWSGIRLGAGETDTEDYWMALTFPAPSYAGAYTMSFTYAVYDSCASKAEVYLMQGRPADAAAAEAAIKQDNLVTTVQLDTTQNRGKHVTVELGDVVLTESEYTLVFRGTQMDKYLYLAKLHVINDHLLDAAETVDGLIRRAYNPELVAQARTAYDALTPGSKYYVTTLDLLLEAEEATKLNAVRMKYNFALEQQAIGVSECASLAGAQKTIKNAYTEGSINWCYQADNIAMLGNEMDQTVKQTCNFGGGTNPWSGLRLGARVDHGKYLAGYWYAITLKSPGAGSYNMSLEYMTRNDGVPNGKIYLLNEVSDDCYMLSQELTEENLIATVDFTSKQGKNYEDAAAELGEVTLPDGEFTLVFYASDKVNENACAYMVLKSLNVDNTEQKKAAVAVDELIEKATTAESIKAAREAYNKLTEGQKVYVTKLAKLEAAEANLNQQGQDEGGIDTGMVILIVAAVVVTGAVVTVVLVVIRKKQKKD